MFHVPDCSKWVLQNYKFLYFNQICHLLQLPKNQPERPSDLSECFEDKGVSEHSMKNATTYAFI